MSKITGNFNNSFKVLLLPILFSGLNIENINFEISDLIKMFFLFRVYPTLIH